VHAALTEATSNSVPYASKMTYEELTSYPIRDFCLIRSSLTHDVDVV
jgi:hypothetical protein